MRTDISINPSRNKRDQQYVKRDLVVCQKRQGLFCGLFCSLIGLFRYRCAQRVADEDVDPDQDTEFTTRHYRVSFFWHTTRSFDILLGIFWHTSSRRPEPRAAATACRTHSTFASALQVGTFLFPYWFPYWYNGWLNRDSAKRNSAFQSRKGVHGAHGMSSVRYGTRLGDLKK